MLVLHYTGMADAPSALARLCDPATEVSAHYLIEEDGRVFAMVPEDRRAWHAGVSSWRGHTDINSRSIGIELVNPGHEHGLRPFPNAQMTALLALTRAILARHPIPPRNVVGHSDVAPGRKIDPGELFDWGWLAAHGVGLWPSAPAAPGPVPEMLARYGYAPGPDALAAFQRHFRPRRIDGVSDIETAGLLAGLLAQVAA
jgi:N-acetylmuramoyl-L-alanine amidase